MGSLVTILTTVKNGEKTIKKTIESVVNQSYKNIEYIIIDDGSTDNTHDILDFYEKKYSKISVYRTGGIGRPQALNKGIVISKGRYIAILDADDLFHPKKIEIQMKVLENNPDLFLVSTESDIIYDDNEHVWKEMEIKDEYELEVITSKILIRNNIAHSSVMMNKNILKKIGMYNQNRKTQVDYELWLRAHNYELKIVKISLSLTAKRLHENQSYENKRRFEYIKNATVLQLTNIYKNKTHWYYLPIPILKFILLFLPMRVRRKLASILH